MKSLWSRLLLLLVVLFVGSACTNDDTIDPAVTGEVGEISGVTEDLNVKADGPVGEVSMIEHYEAMIQQLSQSNSEEDMALLELAQADLDAVKEYTEELCEQEGINADDYTGKDFYIGYKYTRILYTSIDENNRPIQLSALVVWPNNKRFKTPKADGLVIGCHVTITDNKECPSNYKNQSWTTDVGMLAMAAKTHGITSGHGAAFENLVVIPDYQGYGISSDRIHPYLYQDLTARQVVDGVRAGLEFYADIKEFEDDWHSISMGYSQGGSVALAVHKYIEENNLSEELRFRGSLCGDGPYDPMSTVKRYVKEDKIFMPVAVGLILKGMVDANPYIRGKYTAADFFTQKFLDTGILDMIQKKDKDTGKIQNALMEYSKQFDLSEGKFVMYRKTDGNFEPYTKDNMRKENDTKRDWEDGDGTVYGKASDILRPEVFEWIKGNKDLKHATKMTNFEKAMDMNCMSKTKSGWKPKARALLIHSRNDEVVPIDNYKTARSEYEDNSTFTGVEYSGSIMKYHVGFGKLFYIRLTDEGSRRLFEDDFKNGVSYIYNFDEVLFNGLGSVE